MTCDKCGYDNDMESVFCENCGNQLIDNTSISLSNENYNIEMSDSYFDGGLFQQIGWIILGVIVTVLTFGICLPWAFCMQYDWEIKHTVIEGKRLCFNGTSIQLFGKWLLWLLLSLVTFGIYAFWIPIKLKKWKTEHTFFEENIEIIGETNSEPYDVRKIYCENCGSKISYGDMKCPNCHCDIDWNKVI